MRTYLLVLILAGGAVCRGGPDVAADVPDDSAEEAPTADEGTAPVVAGGEIANRVRFVVGDVAITQTDIDLMKAELQSGKQPPAKLEEAATNRLIERAIVEMEAEKESILVTDERIENEIKRRRTASGMEDPDDFRKQVESETGLKFESWVETLRFEIVKRQLVQIKISVPQPSESEIEAFYRKNKTRVGMEVRFREMLFVPKNADFAEERRVSKLASDAYERVRGNPASFAEIARSLPENVSPLKRLGGLQDYAPIHEIAERDLTLAGVLFNAGERQVPQPFRLSGNRYMLVYVEGKRPIALDRVREQIRERLYFDKENEAFAEWLKKRRKQIAITEPQATP